MLFEFIEKYNKHSSINIKQCKFTKVDKKVYATILTSNSQIIIYGVRKKEPLVAIFNQMHNIAYFEFLDGYLFYVNDKKTIIINIESRQKIHQGEAGVIFPITNKQYLLVNENTLKKINFYQKSVLEIKKFQHPILNYVGSKIKDIFALSSNITYIYQINQGQLLQLQHVFSRLLYIDNSNIAGISIDNSKIIVRNIIAGISVYQIQLSNCNMFDILKQKIFIMDEKSFRVYDMNEDRKFEIQINQKIIGMLLNVVAIYIINSDLQLYGLTLQAIQKLQFKSIKDKPIKQVEQSLIFEDLSKSSYQQQNQQFQIKGLLNNIKEQHSAVLLLLNHRNNSLKGIYKWWVNGNQKAAIYAIQNHEEISVINDSFKFITKNIEKIPIELIQCLVRVSKRLIQSKYNSHVQTSLKFMINLLDNINNQKFPKSAIIEFQCLKKNKRLERLLNSKYPEGKKHIFEYAYTLNSKLERLLRNY